MQVVAGVKRHAPLRTSHFSGETIETVAELRKRIAHGFRRPADADPKGGRCVEEPARNHRHIETCAKKLTELIDIATRQSRKGDRSAFRPKVIEIVAGTQKAP